MKKALLPSLMVVCLSGCSSHYGQINCETIRVVDNGWTLIDGAHKEGFGDVNEYMSKTGDLLYTDCVIMNQYVAHSPGYQSQPAPLFVYATKGSEERVEYTFNRRVGPIGLTENYYLDLKAKTIEAEFIYNDTALSYPQFRQMEGAEEAYECAKKGYYHISGFEPVYLDETPKGFEYHTFYTFSEEAELSYAELK